LLQVRLKNLHRAAIKLVRSVRCCFPYCTRVAHEPVRKQYVGLNIQRTPVIHRERLSTPTKVPPQSNYGLMAAIGAGNTSGFENKIAATQGVPIGYRARATAA